MAGHVNLSFPLAGVDRRQAFQAQPPYTTPDALNVRPAAPWTGREGGGLRPGLLRHAPEQLGSGSPIRMLASVHRQATTGLTYWLDSFTGDSLNSELWTAAAWEPLGLPRVWERDEATSGLSRGGAVRAAISPFTASSDYTLELFCTPYRGGHHGRYRLYARLNDATPVLTTDGIEVELELLGEGGAYRGVLRAYNGGSLTEYPLASGSHGAPVAGLLRLTLSSSGTVATVNWNGTQLISQAVTLGASAGNRVGFGLETVNPGGVCLADYFRIQYASGVTGLRTELVASSGGTLYRESTGYGRLTAVSSTLNLASDRLIQATARTQLLLIADWAEAYASITDGVLAANGRTLTSASIADWTALGMTAASVVVVITSASGGTAAGTYAVSAIASGSLTLATSAGQGTAIVCTVQRAPKIFDPAAGTLSLWSATAGATPTGCPLLCLYRNRAVLAGAQTAPHVWHMSRQGNHLDWNTGADPDDPGRAVSGQSADAGEIGMPLTALIPHSDDYLILAAAEQLWVLRGDPTAGGYLSCLSRTLGVVDAGAWCYGPHGQGTVFLSHDGLHYLGPGGSQFPEPLSRERLPRDLTEVDRTNHTALLAYDEQGEGVWIFLTERGAGSGSRRHWWFDWRNRGFWPVSFAAAAGAHDPTAAVYYQSLCPVESGPIVGCRDGYLRRFHDRAANDDGTAISSYVDVGPIRMTGPGGDREGVLTELGGTLAVDLGSATWSVRTGDSPESAFRAAAFASGSWSAGWNRVARPRVRGAALVVRVAGVAHQPWGLESLRSAAIPGGRQRG